MWINNKNVGSILAPIVFPTLSIEAWNAMQWNGMKWYEESCTLDNKAFTHYSIICMDRRRDDPAYVLFSLLAANIWNALFDVSTRKKLTSAREMCEEMQEIEIETAPEPASLFPIVPLLFYRWRNIDDWYKLILMKLFIILFLESI